MKTFIKLFFILFLSGLTAIAGANIIHVPGDYSSIQMAINSATNGDTILVESGTYNENINFNGKAITVGSLFITTGDESYIENTVINGGGYPSCVKFNNGESFSSVLSGFTLTNGGNYYGAGIHCYSASSPTLSHLIVSNNNGDSGDSYGGGLCCLDGSNPKVSYVIFEDNYANEGGAVYCHNNSSPQFDHCVFFGNTSARGGAVQIAYSNPGMNYCLFYNNSAEFAGGAVYVYAESNPTFDHCTFTENQASWGGAIYCNELGGAPIINNSILWNDISDYDLEIFATSTVYPPVVTYSNIDNGSSQDWFGNGCIEQDPLFADVANNNYDLTADSPCINTGDPMSPPDEDGSVTDMGAFPFLELLPPGEAFEPIPADQSIEVELNQILGWTNGEYTETIDLYFGTENPPTEMALEDVNVESFEPSALEYGTTYYWQVVCKNDVGTTGGPVWSFATDVNTGIKDLSNELTIYPNPASDYISILLNIEIDEIQIFNLLGNLVFSSNINKQINISELSSGIYTVRLISETKTTTEQLVIK